MRTGLVRNVNGTLPILYVFLARLGYRSRCDAVKSVRRVKITFTRAGTLTLCYFKTGRRQQSVSALVPSAVRTPQHNKRILLAPATDFQVRNLLQHSRLIGGRFGIPLRLSEDEDRCYGATLHGRVRNIINPLAALYAPTAPPPRFAFGYHWQKRLMLATAKRHPLPARKAARTPHRK